MSGQQILSNHDEKNPFGIAFGYETNLGIVGWASTEGAVHGYIWDHVRYRWILEAKRPQDKEKGNKRSEGDSNFKKKVKRKKESR